MNNNDYNDQDYINNLVDNYKKIGKDKEELIEAFYPYFNKYSNLMCGVSCINTMNKDTRRFLRLFMNANERETDASTLIAGAKYIHLLRKAFCDYTKQDMFDEMLLFFLEALERYKPMIADHKRTRERISFTHFIQVTLRYKLKALVMTKLGDALTGDKLLQFDENISSDLSYSYVEDWRDINLNWIHGENTNDIFKQLDSIERYLLWIKYESDPNGKVKSTFQVSRTTGLHKKTIDYRLKKIRKKLKPFLNSIN